MSQETNDNNVFEDIKKRLTPVACCDCVAAHSENQGGGRGAAQTHRWRAAASVWWRTLFLLLSSSWKSFFQIQISPLSSFHPHAAENRVCVCVDERLINCRRNNGEMKVWERKREGEGRRTSMGARKEKEFLNVSRNTRSQLLYYFNMDFFTIISFRWYFRVFI